MSKSLWVRVVVKIGMTMVYRGAMGSVRMLMKCFVPFGGGILGVKAVGGTVNGRAGTASHVTALRTRRSRASRSFDSVQVHAASGRDRWSAKVFQCHRGPADASWQDRRCIRLPPARWRHVGGCAAMTDSTVVCFARGPWSAGASLIRVWN